MFRYYKFTETLIAYVIRTNLIYNPNKFFLDNNFILSQIIKSVFQIIKSIVNSSAIKKKTSKKYWLWSIVFYYDSLPKSRKYCYCDLFAMFDKDVRIGVQLPQYTNKESLFER